MEVSPVTFREFSTALDEQKGGTANSTRYTMYVE